VYAIRVAVALLAALALAAPVLAQVGEQEEMASFALSGSVRAVDTAKHTLTIDAPNDEGGVLAVDPKAELLNGDRTIGLAEVKTGWRVVVNGDLRGDRRVVTYLEVVDAP